MKEEREDERFRRLDETIRNSQKSRKEKAAVAKEEKRKWNFFGQKKGQAV